MKRVDEVKLNEVYKYICDCHSEERRSPSLREIASACDINSTAWVSSLLQILEERELISFETKGNKRTISVPDNLNVGATRNASIVGSCPCGEPVLAVENIVSTVALPVEIFGADEHFILRATGNSMVKRGIFNGDLMVVRVQNTANVGEVVIARVNNEEATAKVLAKSRGKYYLKPANDEVDEDGNPLYRDIHPVGEWEILGVVDNVIHSPAKEV
jgi:repressor LexA